MTTHSEMHQSNQIELEQLRDILNYLHSLKLTTVRPRLREAVANVTGEIAALELEIKQYEQLKAAADRGEQKAKDWYERTVPEDKRPHFPFESE